MKFLLSPTSLALLLALSASPAMAGFPPGSDDADTVGNLQYQIEARQDHKEGGHGYTLTPALGLGDFEFGLETIRSREAEGVRSLKSTPSLKWAPQSLSLGPVRFGAKAWGSQGWKKAEGEYEDSREWGGIGIASWAINEQVSAHLNLGALRNTALHQTQQLANVALTWTPHEKIQFFAEALHQETQPTTRSLGLRFWPVADRLALDLASSKQAGLNDSRSISIGFGWFGSFAD